MQMFSIKINGTIIDKYLKSYDVKIVEQFSSSPNYVAVSGKTIRNYLGDKRQLTISFEPMENSQIQTLFASIKSSREISVEYIDPQLGLVTKKFTCENLPAASYFVSDDGRKFWTLPDVLLEEVTNFSGGSG